MQVAGQQDWRNEADSARGVMHGMALGDAVTAPKVHSQSTETFVDERLPDNVKASLAAMGHRIWEQRDHPGLNAFRRVCAVSRETDDSRLHGASFPGWRCDAMAI
ncbi:MAG: gamma-glutamyltransferase [Rhodospirillales bacterium]|nr:gamma-glutamyltransferase [Rhodospirillales bacterium]